MHTQTEPATSEAADCGCGEFRTSRRRVLQGAAALTAGVAFNSVAGGVFREAAFAASGVAGNMLVVLSLRGGVDGLSLVVPHGDQTYYDARPTLAIPSDRLIGKGPRFGLHPALAPLLPMWLDGSFGAVQAVGLPVPNRSHFAAMEEMEDADPGSALRRGWLNRMVGLNTVGNPLEAVMLGKPTVPTSLYGASPVVAAGSLKQLKLGGTGPEVQQRTEKSLHRVWDKATGPMGRAARSALQTVGTVQTLATTKEAPRNGAVYPGGAFGVALSETARLLRADVGAEVVTVDYGSWDMHSNLGTREGGGSMAIMTAVLAQGIAAFFKDLGAALGSRVTMVTISEFGRRVDENGNRGLDHGYGNAMLLFGGGVKGGDVYGKWPGLGPAQRIDGDLAVTRDYRSVLTEVLRSRFPATDASKVFPGFLPETALGAMMPPPS